MKLACLNVLLLVVPGIFTQSFTQQLFAQQLTAEQAIEKLRDSGAKVYIDEDSVPYSVDLFRSSGTEEIAKCLGAIKTLREIDFGQRKFNNDAMRYLVDLPDLVEVNLSLVPITDDGLKTLVKNKNIEILDLTGVELKDLSPLAKLTKLKSLDLQHCFVTDEKLSFLEDLSSIEALYLGSTEITDKGVETLARLPRLKSLSLPHCRITDAAVPALIKCESLVEIQLAYQIGKSFDPSPSYISKQGLEKLKSAKPHLDIYGTEAFPIFATVRLRGENGESITRELMLDDLLRINDKSAVTMINLAYSILDDAQFKPIAQFENLEELYLARTWITDDSLIQISTLKHLKVLDLNDTRVTDVGAAKLASCTLLEKLYLDDTLVQGECFEKLVALDKLKDLSISRYGHTGFGPRLSLNDGLNDAALESIGKMTSLELLNLDKQQDKTRISEDGMRHIFNLKKLKQLGIRDVPISDTFKAQLKSELPNAELRYRRITGGLG